MSVKKIKTPWSILEKCISKYISIDERVKWACIFKFDFTKMQKNFHTMYEIWSLYLNNTLLRLLIMDQISYIVWKGDIISRIFNSSTLFINRNCSTSFYVFGNWPILTLKIFHIFRILIFWKSLKFFDLEKVSVFEARTEINLFKIFYLSMKQFFGCRC
jgi:hypothetical protein